MQAGRRLIQYVNRLARAASRQLRRELDALRFSAGERGSRLSELHIPESDLVQDRKPRADLLLILEEVDCLLNRHVEHIRDVLALKAHLQRFAVIALAVAHLTGHIHVREKMHFDLQQTVSGAGLAAASACIEGKPSCLIASQTRILRRCKKCSNVIEQSRISRRIRARRASNRTLVDGDHLVDVFQTVDSVALPCTQLCAMELGSQFFIENIVDQRGFAAARNARHAGHRSKRDVDINMLEIVLACAANLQEMPVAFSAFGRHGDRAFAGKILARNGFLTGADILITAGANDLTAVYAGARADVDDMIRRAHRILVVLDNDQGVPKVAQMIQRLQQLLVVSLMQANGRLVQYIQHAHQRRADLRCQTDALTLASGERSGGA